MCVVTYGWAACHVHSPSFYAPRARTTLSDEFPMDVVRGGMEFSLWALCPLVQSCHHTMIMTGWGCISSQSSSELRDARWAHDWATVEIHLEVMIVSTWRPWSWKFGDALGVHDWSRLEEHMGVVNLEVVDMEAVGLDRGMTGAETLLIGSLVILRILRVEYNKAYREMSDERWETGWEQITVNLPIM